MVLVGAIAATVAPAVVQAQPAGGVNKREAARQYTEAGLKAAGLHDYDTAYSFYAKAYELVQHPTLIFNMAEAQHLAHHDDKALPLYRRYLDDKESAEPLLQAARDRIAEIEADRKAEEDRKTAAARKAEDDRKAAAARKAEDDRQAAARKAEDDRSAAARNAEADRAAAQAASSADGTSAPGSASATGAPPHTADAAPGRTLRIAGIAGAGGGAVVVGVGIAYLLRAQRLSNELSVPGAPFDSQKESDGKTANRIGIACTVTGSVVILAGAGLFSWGYLQGRSPEKLAVAPVVSSQLTGLALSGTWP
jgi:hypothetical protein